MEAKAIVTNMKQHFEGGRVGGGGNKNSHAQGKAEVISHSRMKEKKFQHLQ